MKHALKPLGCNGHMISQADIATDRKRAAVRRTVLRVSLIAVAVYAAFLLSAYFGYAGGHR